MLTTFAEQQRQQMFYFAGNFLLDRFRRFFSWGVASASALGRNRQRVLLTSTKSRLNCCHFRYSSISCSALRRAATLAKDSVTVFMSLIGEAEVGAMPGVSGAVAVAGGIATAAAGGGDRTGSEIAQLSDLAQQGRLLILAVRQRLWHDNLQYLAYYIRKVLGAEKRKPHFLTFMSRTRALVPLGSGGSSGSPFLSGG